MDVAVDYVDLHLYSIVFHEAANFSISSLLVAGWLTVLYKHFVRPLMSHTPWGNVGKLLLLEMEEK